MRLGLPSGRTTAYRLVNSEGDDLPGLVVDIYGDAAVVQITTLGMALRRALLFDAVEAELAPKTVFEVAAQSYAELEGFSATSRVARGESRTHISCLEDGIRLEVEPLGGQKTGMFIDQRENRVRVGRTGARRARSRLLRLRRWVRPAGGPRRRDVGHRRRQLGARGRPHRRARHRQRRGHRRRRVRCLSLLGDGDAARRTT